MHQLEEKRVFKDEKDKELEARRLQHIRKTQAEEIDDKVFGNMSSKAHVR